MMTTGAAAMAVASGAMGAAESATDKPNILWITTEDISPHLGCYGDPVAETPNLDKFAGQGVRYTRAYANCSICAPARSTLITGTYAMALGSQHMRSLVARPSEVPCLPQVLRQAGYYCSNNSKTDYNFSPADVWDACSGSAHWRNRAEGQPFFSVFNLLTTHEGRNMRGDFDGPLDRYNNVPPFYPDTPGVRREWASSYRNIHTMDRQVADILKQLEDDGLADDTIVFFFSDHGTGMPRGKFWLYEFGLQVPLLIRFPDRFRALAPAGPGSVVDQLVSFVDFAPSVLSLCGVPIPETWQGRPFLGNDKQPPGRYVFAGRDRLGGCLDLIRSAADARYKYIRNFQPFIPQDWESVKWYLRQHVSYRELERLKAAGELNADQLRFVSGRRRPAEELYDLRNDLYELHNLADSGDHADTLRRMRGALRDWMIETGDLGLIPEHEMLVRAGRSAPYLLRPDLQKVASRLLDLVDLELDPNPDAAAATARGALRDDDALVRYWALVALGDIALRDADRNRYLADLTPMLDDDSEDVRVCAGDVILRLGFPERAVDSMLGLLQSTDSLVRMRAMAVLFRYPPSKSEPILSAMKRAAHAPGFDYAKYMMKSYIKALINPDFAIR